MTSPVRNQTHIRRIMNDVQQLYRENPTGIYITPQEDNLSLVHALLIGPKETPYENGFFYFLLKFPADYPLKPPHVKLKTTFGKTVRFNPNLYANGKVCLSILGTWAGPSWSPIQNILSTLRSIQSLMTEHPYHNEPGFEKIKSRTRMRTRSDVVQKNVDDYNDMITHETLRVAVIEMLQENGLDACEMPAFLKETMISYFKTNYQFYENLIQSKQKYDGKPIRDPHRDPRPPKFMYIVMLENLLKLKEKFVAVKDALEEVKSESEDSSLSDLSDLHESESEK